MDMTKTEIEKWSGNSHSGNVLNRGHRLRLNIRPNKRANSVQICRENPVEKNEKCPKTLFSAKFRRKQADTGVFH
jgi:hypothetical protein